MRGFLSYLPVDCTNDGCAYIHASDEAVLKVPMQDERLQDGYKKHEESQRVAPPVRITFAFSEGDQHPAEQKQTATITEIQKWVKYMPCSQLIGSHISKDISLSLVSLEAVKQFMSSLKKSWLFFSSGLVEKGAKRFTEKEEWFPGRKTRKLRKFYFQITPISNVWFLPLVTKAAQDINLPWNHETHQVYGDKKQFAIF